MRLAERLLKMPPYPFAELEGKVERRRKRGEIVLDFTIGDPDLPPPDFVVDAVVKSARSSEFRGYSTSRGERWFREAVADWFSRRFGVDVDPESEVCALIGSKEGLANITRAFVSRGDRVLCPEPGYPVYANGAALLSEGIPVPLRLKPPSYLPTNFPGTEEGAALMFLNYPNNPTGAVVDKAELKPVLEYVETTMTPLCYDNAYSEVTFRGFEAPSILQVVGIDLPVVEFHSLSKTFSMTGMRIGFAVGNKDIISALAKVKSQVDSGPSKISQHAARTALESYSSGIPKYVLAMRREYERRLNSLASGLRDLGLDARSPRATFYLWHSVPYSSTEFCANLDSLGIFVTPGKGFGQSVEGFVRWSVTVPAEDIERALEMMDNSRFHFGRPAQV